MENGKAFPYVPIYSLPINPCSALVPSAPCMHIAFPLHIRSISQCVLTSGYLLYGLCLPRGAAGRSTVPLGHHIPTHACSPPLAQPWLEDPPQGFGHISNKAARL